MQALVKLVPGRKSGVPLVRKTGKDVAKRFSCQRTGLTEQSKRPIF